jgi:hypothetical protein
MSSKTRIYKNMRMLDVESAAGWIVEAVAKRPARVTSMLGTLGGIALAALPGTVTRYTQPLFRRMDKRLKAKLETGPG